MRFALLKKLLSCVLILCCLLSLVSCGVPASLGGRDSGADVLRSSTVTVEGETLPCPYYRYEILPDNSAKILQALNVRDSLTIPEAIDGIPVSTLGRDMLRGDLLTTGVTITIPDCVTTLEGNPFDGEVLVRDISVSDTHPTLEVKDGVLFSKPDKRLVRAFFRNMDHYEIPEGTLAIEDHAFWYAACPQGTIHIPDSVTTLGKNPFAFCNPQLVYGLFTITVSETHPSLEIVDGMLYSKPDHRLICYADPKANVIGDGSERKSSYTIPDGVECLDDYAFYSLGGFNNRLETIRIPASIKTVGENPFFGQYLLRALELDSANTALQLEGNLLYDRAEKRLVAAADLNQSAYTVAEGTKTIGAYAFADAPHIGEAWQVTLPDSVTEIGSRAFMGGSQLRCNIPADVRRIGVGAFANTRIDNELVFNGGVVIEDGAFSVSSGCPVKSLTVGAGDTWIGRGAFFFCSSLSSVSIGEGDSCIANSAFSNSGIAEAVFGEGLSAVGGDAFSFCHNLKKLVLPGSVRYLEDLYNDVDASQQTSPFGTDTVFIQVPVCTAEVYVKQGSYAETFCQDNGIPCRYLGE